MTAWIGHHPWQAQRDQPEHQSHRKVQGEDGDAAGQQGVDGLLGIPAGPAVAVAVDHDGGPGARPLAQEVAALQLVPPRIGLQRPAACSAACAGGCTLPPG